MAKRVVREVCPSSTLPWGHSVLTRLDRVLCGPAHSTLQDGSIERDSFLAAAGVSDGGVVAAGYSNGTWNSEDGWGQLDFAAVKLDSDGNVAWIWQVR